MKPLPAGPWEVLFQRALRLVDDIQRHGGLADPFWTFGGGTVLMFRYGHRISKDIDIFVPDPQYLGYVTPRLSDTAASLTEEYTEMPGSFVKLQFEEGEVDFVAAPNLTDAAWERWEIQGRPVRVETAAEVIAKKMYHRGDRATARDLFDLSMVVEREPEALAAVTLPPENVPLAECFNASKEYGNDEDSAGALHAGVQAGSCAVGGRRAEHCSGGQIAGRGGPDAVQLGQG